MRGDADRVDAEACGGLGDRVRGVVAADDVGLERAAGWGECEQLVAELGLVDLGVVVDDVGDVDLGADRERVGHGAVGERGEVGRDEDVRDRRDAHRRDVRDRRHADDGLVRVMDDDGGDGAEAVEAGLLARADDDRIDFLLVGELDDVVADAAQAAARAGGDVLVVAEPAQHVARQQALDLRIAIDERARVEAVVVRGVVGVVDRAEHDLDRAAGAQRVRPLDAELAGDRVVDAEEEAQGALAAREAQPGRRIADDEDGHAGRGDHALGGRAEAQERAGLAARGDDDEVAALGVGERDERLIGGADDELGADRGAGAGGRNLCVELCACGLDARLVVDHVDEDDVGVAALGGERTCDLERAGRRGREVSTADDRHQVR